MKRTVIFGLLAFLSTPVLAQPFDSPRELFDELERLRAGPCNLACQTQIAGMYRREFLESLHHAMMFGLQDEANRESNSLILFGEVLEIDELEVMDSQEFVARQFLHIQNSLPAEMILTKTEIIHEERISNTEVEFTVIRSGLEGLPDYKEEDLMVFVFEDGTWKLKF